MPKKYNDYYDHENQVQYDPQTWQCTKCPKQVKVLVAEEVVHKCPSNQAKITPFKKL